MNDMRKSILLDLICVLAAVIGLDLCTYFLTLSNSVANLLGVLLFVAIIWGIVEYIIYKIKQF